MRSIRRKLVVSLVVWLGLLWIVAGATVYLSVRQGLIATLDGELTSSASAIQARLRTSPHGPRPGDDSTEPFDLPSGSFFQAWRAEEDEPLQQSASLGDRTLPRPADLDARPTFWDHELPGGERVRVLGMRVMLLEEPPDPLGRNRGRGPGADHRPPRRPPPPRPRRMSSPVSADIVVASPREELDQTLALVLGGIAAVGSLGALIAAFIVVLALRHGLKPLQDVAGRVSSIDEKSLGWRFATEGMPIEMLPICECLNDLLARLEQSFERERRFSSDLAHELRTPVAELKALAEVAVRWPHRASPRDYEQVLAISERMQSLLESLLALARWEAGSQGSVREEVVVSQIVEEAWKPFAERAGEKRLVVEWRIRSEAVLTTNPRMLDLILQNLFSNAVEYTPEGGVVRIEAGHGPSGLFELSISNSTVDLSPDVVPHLFERFWRLDLARTDSAHIGIGLSLARACAEAVSLELTASLDGELLSFSLRATEA